MEAPERIWTCNETKNIWISEKQEDTTEYIRADTVTTLQEEVDRLREALNRVATPSAFYVATSAVDPEAYGRMVYAEMVLKGLDLEEAEAMAEAAVRSRFAPPLKEDT
ncbi:hypothetical protein MACH17_18070 [Phaeobacter inhibens]|uniref:hypothetical protein n=1 Tax=Phaeobacter inhibens TaxID=221822 RepID=UPI0027433C20|nr:hypothetical protein [Phaeobacter inhibens]GLO70290.1 hypothetical protein MACH17_18070 [Phaeobacter inhibens]